MFFTFELFGQKGKRKVSHVKKKGTKETNQKVKERQSKRWRLRPVLESWLKVDLYRGGVGEGGGGGWQQPPEVFVSSVGGYMS